MAKKKDKKQNLSPTIQNRRAAHDYHFLETFEAGIVLTGTEIKSVRESRLQMHDAFCFFHNSELYIKNMEISKYTEGSFYNHDEKRLRKLLLKKQELKRLKLELKEQRLTIVPVTLFFNDRGIAKLTIALAMGKKLYDKRETLKKKDAQREIDRSNK